jgi:DNA-directed RNA polymerase sigma subunit (sigma70/sigma32)
MNANILKNKKDIALSILQKLNKREQKVILKDIEYKKHFKYLPDDVTETLSVEMGVKKDTIRKIRKRAIEKINKLINGINGEETEVL